MEVGNLWSSDPSVLAAAEAESARVAEVYYRLFSRFRHVLMDADGFPVALAKSFPGAQPFPVSVPRGQVTSTTIGWSSPQFRAEVADFGSTLMTLPGLGAPVPWTDSDTDGIIIVPQIDAGHGPMWHEVSEADMTLIRADARAERLWVSDDPEVVETAREAAHVLDLRRTAATVLPVPWPNSGHAPVGFLHDIGQPSTTVEARIDVNDSIFETATVHVPSPGHPYWEKWQDLASEDPEVLGAGSRGWVFVDDHVAMVRGGTVDGRWHRPLVSRLLVDAYIRQEYWSY